MVRNGALPNTRTARMTKRLNSRDGHDGQDGQDGQDVENAPAGRKPRRRSRILVGFFLVRRRRSRPRRRAGRRRRRTGPDGQSGVRNGWTARTACAPYLSLLAVTLIGEIL